VVAGGKWEGGKGEKARKNKKGGCGQRFRRRSCKRGGRARA